jgi:hypothetical protein
MVLADPPKLESILVGPNDDTRGTRVVRPAVLDRYIRKRELAEQERRAGRV